MTSDSRLATRRMMSRFEQWLGQRLFGVVVISLLLVILYGIMQYLRGTGALPLHVDWVGLSAVPVAVAGFAVAIHIPERADRTLMQLANRGVVQFGPEGLDDLRHEVARRVAAPARRGALVGLVVILPVAAGFLIGSVEGTLHRSRTGPGLPLAIAFGQIVIVALAILLFGCLGGYYAGYAISVGRWARLLRTHGDSLKVRPGHPDGAAGWAPLGSLYLFQALALAIPALYYGIWSFLVAENVDQLQRWYPGLLTPYLILFFSLLSVEMLAFVAPVWSFHNDMRRQKTAMEDETDKLSDRIVTIPARIVETDDPDEAYKCIQQLTAMTTYYRACQTMPTWPVNTNVAVRFVLGNVGLLLPVLAQVLLPHFGS